ncbi:MAG: hypothetical protein WA755_07240 [Candidatus Acidiferrales bacterium]
MDLGQMKQLSYLAGIIFVIAGIVFCLAHHVPLGAAFVVIGAFWFIYPQTIRKGGE